MNSERDGIALYVMCLTSSLTPIYSPIFQDLDLSTVQAGEFSHTNSPRIYIVAHPDSRVPPNSPQIKGQV